MLIPQFSLRWMLAAIALLAVVSLLVSRATQGSAWAVGVSAALLMLAIVAGVQGALFFLIYLVSLVSVRRPKPLVAAAATVVDSPFKSDAPAAEPSGSNNSPST